MKVRSLAELKSLQKVIAQRAAAEAARSSAGTVPDADAVSPLP